MREYDQFAQPINLSFKGKSHYPSLIGSILTVLMYITVFMYAVIQLETIVIDNDFSFAHLNQYATAAELS